MANTRGNLTAAKIIEVDDEGENISDGLSVDCMFNPFEYTVSKSNTYSEEPNNGSSTPEVEFQKSGPQTLQLNLTFDTYETGADVSLTTNQLWKFMEPGEGEGEDKDPPPKAAFVWGVFRFVAVITQMTQRFTLFKPDGTPVRATVQCTFTQYDDQNDYPNQNPTSGGGPIQRVRSLVRGDRLDSIAAEVYGDATKWRAIAEYNEISDPLALRPGQRLIIPEL
jgi:hypothetical protein